MQISKKSIFFLFIFFVSFSRTVFGMWQVGQDKFSDTPEDTFEVLKQVDLITMLPEMTREGYDLIGFKKWTLSACGRYLAAVGKIWESVDSDDDDSDLEEDERAEPQRVTKDARLVEVYDLKEKKKVFGWKCKDKAKRRFRGRRGISGLDISVGGKCLVVGRACGQVKVFDVEAERDLFEYEHMHEVKIIKFTDNGRFLFSAAFNSEIKVYDLKNKTELFCKKLKNSVCDLFLTNNGRFLTVKEYCEAHVTYYNFYVYDILSGERLLNFSLNADSFKNKCFYITQDSKKLIYNGDQEICVSNPGYTIPFTQSFEKNGLFLSWCDKYLVLVTNSRFRVYNLIAKKLVFQDDIAPKVHHIKSFRVNKNGDTLFIAFDYNGDGHGIKILLIKTSENFQASHRCSNVFLQELQEQLQKEDEKERETFIKHDKKNNILNFELKNTVTDEKFQVCKSFLSL